MADTAKSILKQYWGYDEFRSIQEDVIKSVLEGKDTLAFAQTGMGKTVLFQIPAMLLPGITIVISPLLALQKDQVDSCLIKGLPATMLNSGLGVRARKQVIQDIKDDKIKLLYVAPETLLTEAFRTILEGKLISLIAVDESHCCSSWGDFRPDYQKIYKIREYYPDAPVLAVTATADENIRKDIVKYIGLKPTYKLFTTSFDRPTINYHIIPKVLNGYRQITKLINLNGRNSSGIIYCTSQKSTEELAEYLTKLGYSAAAYHASIKNKLRIDMDGKPIPPEDKTTKKMSDVKFKAKIQEDFLSGETTIICATIAFGMGIDKPDVKYVIHADPPSSLDGYSQEVGRASRNGQPASAYLLYDSKSYGTARWLISQTVFDADRLAIRLGKLNQVHNFCKAKQCRRAGILRYFGEDYPYINCGSCDHCGCELLNE